MNRKRMTAAMWPEVFAKSRWRTLGRSYTFPKEKGVETWEMVSEEWAKCPSCGYVPLGGICVYCGKTLEPVLKLETRPVAGS